MPFAWDVKIDGTNVAPVTLEGASIDYGRRSVFEQPQPPVAILTLLTEDAVPGLGFTYPEFGLGNHSMPSGFVDAYADLYEGPMSRITLGAPVQVNAGTESGFQDVYVDVYGGVEQPRFTGSITAIDYTPATIQLTCSTQLEAWSRINVGGTDDPAYVPIPQESDVARVQRYCLEAGVTIQIDGPPSAQLLAVPKDQTDRPLLELLVEVATDSGGLLFVDRENVVHFQTRDYTPAAAAVTPIPPATTLLDSLLMSLDSSLIRNRVTVFYGDPDPVTNLKGRTVVEDAASVQAFGYRDATFDTTLATFEDATKHANWLLSALRAGWTMPDAEVAMATVPDTIMAGIAALEQQDKVRLPQFLPGSPVTSYDAVVLGYTETLSDRDWRVNLHLTPNQFDASRSLR